MPIVIAGGKRDERMKAEQAKLIISSGEAEVERPEVQLEFLCERSAKREFEQVSRIISLAQSDRWRELADEGAESAAVATAL